MDKESLRPNANRFASVRHNFQELLFAEIICEFSIDL